MSDSSYDAVVVGSGPNGLSAAIRLAQVGLRVLVVEGAEQIGGGTRTLELTLPGFKHDICSAIHPLAVSSPYLKTLPLANHGLEWVYPAVQAAHPLDHGRAVLLHKDLRETTQTMPGAHQHYVRQFENLVERFDDLLESFLGPVPLPPRHPFLLVSFGLRALLPATTFANALLAGEEARAAFGGMAAHSVMPLDRVPTAAFGMILLLGLHAVGWPMAKGGSQSIANAMAGYLRSLGGEIETGRWIGSLDELPDAKIKLFDLSPRPFLNILGERLPGGYRSQLQGFRYAPGVFKIDYALSEPIPWTNPDVSRAGTVHVGGTLDEMTLSERDAWEGRHAEKPYVLLAQQSNFDPTRAPQGQHTAWAYCHVPNGSTVDMTDAIEDHIERFAPGFRDVVLQRATHNAAQMQQHNPNYVGGDINGGVQDLPQLFTRPALRIMPYRTPLRGVYLCSSSTPPGGGVHGMAGYHAAQTALRDFDLL